MCAENDLEANGRNVCVLAKPSNFTWNGKAVKRACQELVQFMFASQLMMKFLLFLLALTVELGFKIIEVEDSKLVKGH